MRKVCIIIFANLYFFRTANPLLIFFQTIQLIEVALRTNSLQCQNGLRMVFNVITVPKAPKNLLLKGSLESQWWFLYSILIVLKSRLLRNTESAEIKQFYVGQI